MINPCFLKQTKKPLLFTQSNTNIVAISYINIVNTNNFVISLRYSYSFAHLFEDYESHLKPTYDFFIADNNVQTTYFKVFYQKTSYKNYNDNTKY